MENIHDSLAQAMTNGALALRLLGIAQTHHGYARTEVEAFLREAARRLEGEPLPGTRACDECEGTGRITEYGGYSPTCGNCREGDCDYGHDRQVACWKCNGTGEQER